jgi:hypothetical protein
MTWTDDTTCVRGGGGALLPGGAPPPPAMSSHLNAVLGFSNLAKVEAKMSSMYIVFHSISALAILYGNDSNAYVICSRSFASLKYTEAFAIKIEKA